MTFRRTRLDHVWQNNMSELIEWFGIAEKEAFIGCHRIDDIFNQLAVAATHGTDQLAQIFHAALTRNRHQPAFEQVSLVLTQNEPGL